MLCKSLGSNNFPVFMTPRQLPNNRLDQIGSSPGIQSENWHPSMVAGFSAQ